MTTPQESPVTLLKRLINDGKFAVDIRPNNPAWSPHAAMYAECLERIARSILAFAKANQDTLLDITDCRSHVYTLGFPEGHEPRHRLVVFNPQDHLRGNYPQEKEKPFTFGGTLHLRAVILETVRLKPDHLITQVILACPLWGTELDQSEKGTCVFIRIGTDGHRSNDRFTPQKPERARGISGVLKHWLGSPLSAKVNIDSVLKHLLGISPIRDMEKRAMQMSYRRLDEVIGFPGAEEYLASVWPRLADHFYDLATKSDRSGN